MKRKLVSPVLWAILLLIGDMLLGISVSAQTFEVGAISFVSNQDGNFEIYLMDLDGGNLINLTNHPIDDVSPTWSPDGRFFAFVSYLEDLNSEIYVMDVKTKKRRRLTNHQGLDRDPAWSPDGQWIAFSSSRARDLFAQTDIYKMDVNGNNLQQLTKAGFMNELPAWSPDSQWIAFRSTRNNRGDIYTMNAEGEQLKHLIGTRGATNPTWLLGGKQIAFHNMVQFYLVTPDGQNVRPLGVLPKGYTSPAWSPDDQWIACVLEENPEAIFRNRDSNIYLIPAAGGEPQQLTKHAGKDLSPVWVPSGFFSISPTANIQTTLWGTLKQSGSD